MFLPAGLFLCALSTFCLLFSSRKLTYLEYTVGENPHTVTVAQSGRTVEAISCADENGRACYEIPESLTLEVMPGSPIPDKALLCDNTGLIICEIDAVTPSDTFHTEAHGADSSAESTDTAAAPEVNFHIPFLKRPVHPENCCLVILSTDGEVID